jgi:hypothetical protein
MSITCRTSGVRPRAEARARACARASTTSNMTGPSRCPATQASSCSSASSRGPLREATTRDYASDRLQPRSDARDVCRDRTTEKRGLGRPCPRRCVSARALARGSCSDRRAIRARALRFPPFPPGVSVPVPRDLSRVREWHNFSGASRCTNSWLPSRGTPPFFGSQPVGLAFDRLPLDVRTRSLAASSTTLVRRD